jgi:tight adherence protein B
MIPTFLAIAGSCVMAGAVYGGYASGLAALDLLSRRYVADLGSRLEQLGMETNHLRIYLRYWWLANLACFLFLWLGLGMFPVAMVVAILIFHSARPFLGYLAEGQRIRIRDQMVLAMRALANQVRAGQSLALGLDAVSKELPAPLGKEFRRVVRQYHQGSPLGVSLHALKERLQSDAVTLFVLATLTCHERGGNVAHALERICLALEELQRMEQKRESNAASGRMLVLVLALFPGIFLGMFGFLDPEGTQQMFVTLRGQVVLCIVMAIVFVGVRWAQRIIASAE